jgi:hypothetical protein
MRSFAWFGLLLGLWLLGSSGLAVAQPTTKASRKAAPPARADEVWTQPFIRTFQNREYIVEDTTAIIVYTFERARAGKALPLIIPCFSRDRRSPIYQLTKANIAREYADKPRFVGIVNQQADVAAYCGKCKMYYINRWLLDSGEK